MAKNKICDECLNMGKISTCCKDIAKDTLNGVRCFKCKKFTTFIECPKCKGKIKK